MSNIYSLEPPTKGKVLLRTTLGDLEIELWAKEAPKACRNFVQLCLEGYYDNTIFHRVIKNYLIQGGDPTGTGTGGESIYDGPFADEFHSRLKFNHRGLVACANANRANSNGSQFFVTLDKADFLDKRNTIFGKVVGDTLFNLLRFNDLSTDDSDRPHDPPALLSVEVLWNPFDDLRPRDSARERRERLDRERREEAERQRRQGRVHNRSLLSFGDDEEEEGEQDGGGGMRSSHDVLDDKRLSKEAAVDPALLLPARGLPKRARESSADASDPAPGARRPWSDGVSVIGEGNDADVDANDRIRLSRTQEAEAGRSGGSEPGPVYSRGGERGKSAEKGEAGGGDDDDEDEDDEDEDDEDDKGRTMTKDGRRDFRAERRRELEAMRHEAGGRKSFGRVKVAEEIADADLLKTWQLSRERFLQRRRLVGDRERDTLAKLAKFSAALRTQKVQAIKSPPPPPQESEEAEKEKKEDGKEEKEDSSRGEQVERPVPAATTTAAISIAASSGGEDRPSTGGDDDDGPVAEEGHGRGEGEGCLDRGDEREGPSAAKDKDRDRDRNGERPSREEGRRERDDSRARSRPGGDRTNRYSASRRYDDGTDGRRSDRHRDRDRDRDREDYRPRDRDRDGDPDRDRNRDRGRDREQDRDRDRDRRYDDRRPRGDRDRDRNDRLDRDRDRDSGNAERPPGDRQGRSQNDAETDERVLEPGVIRKKQDLGMEVDPSVDQRLLLPAAWRLDDYLRDDDDQVGVADLVTHKLSFQKLRRDGMDREDNVEDYEVFDPLLEKGKGAFSKTAQREQKRQLEWAGKCNN